MKIILLMLIMFLVSGCEWNTREVIITEIEYIFPPDAYITPCYRQIPLGLTLKEVISHQDRTISGCEDKLSATRDWKERNKNE